MIEQMAQNVTPVGGLLAISLATVIIGFLVILYDEHTSNKKKKSKTKSAFLYL